LNSKKVRNALSEVSQFLPQEINLSIEYTWNLDSYTNFFAPMVFFWCRFLFASILSNGLLLVWGVGVINSFW